MFASKTKHVSTITFTIEGENAVPSILGYRDAAKLGGVVSGLGAAIAAMEVSLLWVCILIATACVLDLLDIRAPGPERPGRKFTVAFDHLAELIPFSMAPSIMIFVAFRMPVEQGGAGWPAWAAGCLAITLAAFGCMRFARDCVERACVRDLYQGLPRPVFALYIATMLTSHLFSNQWITDSDSLFNPVVYGITAAVVVGAGLLTLSRRSYHRRPARGSWWTVRFSFVWFLVTPPLGLAVGLLIGEPRLLFDVLVVNLFVYVMIPLL
jgi:phosphatidylserine synthase